MKKSDTIIDLFNFQLGYLHRIVENISDERLYEKQLEGLNSAGWILGHICVEANDVINYLEIETRFKTLDANWIGWFKNTTGKITSLEALPTKKVLLDTLNERYQTLGQVYLELDEEQRNAAHPSKLLKNVLTTLDAWFAHHLTTHIAVHCGNIVVWKKVIGLPVNGF